VAGPRVTRSPGRGPSVNHQSTAQEVNSFLRQYARTVCCIRYLYWSNSSKSGGLPPSNPAACPEHLARGSVANLHSPKMKDSLVLLINLSVTPNCRLQGVHRSRGVASQRHRRIRRKLVLPATRTWGGAAVSLSPLHEKVSCSSSLGGASAPVLPPQYDSCGLTQLSMPRFDGITWGGGGWGGGPWGGGGAAGGV